MVVSTKAVLTSVARENGLVDFELGQPLLKNQKLATVSSIDFPYSQRTIEKKWSHLHYMEGIIITEENRTIVLTLENKVNKNESLVVNGLFPLRCNKLSSITKRGKTEILIQFEEPHGFFVPSVFGNASRNVMKGYKSIFDSRMSVLTMIHAKAGALDIDPDMMKYEDEYAISIPFEPMKKIISFGKQNSSWFLTPIFSSLSQLTAAASIVLNSAILFNACEMTCKTKIEEGHCSSRFRIVGLEGDMIKTLFGEGGVFNRYETAELPVGMYCYGEFSISEEIQRSMNRWHLCAKSNFIFRDSKNYTWSVTLPKGNYQTPQNVAKTIESLMNSTVRKKMFCVKCLQSSAGKVKFVFYSDFCFSLLFGDENSMDSCFLGFESVDHVGLFHYTSKHEMHCPIQPNSNVYKCYELEGSHQLRIARESRRSIDLKMVSYKGGVLKGVCYDRHSDDVVASGLSCGEVVSLTPLLPKPQESERSEVRVRQEFSLKTSMKAVVVKNEGGEETEESVSVVYLSVPNLGWNAGSFVTLDFEVAPLSICLFDKEKPSRFFDCCIGASRLGFNSGITHGKNGVVTAPWSVNLEPLSVSVSFTGSVAVQRTDFQDEEGNPIICQIPSERSHHFQTSDFAFHTTPTRFTLLFKNADGTPYEFNNSKVSLVMKFSELDKPSY